jgi:phosphoribosylformimino-5-aminoimidazole carboxamide ribonucleotide (ProFAR) isomerase
MKGKPDIKKYLEGGAADKAVPKSVPQDQPKAVARITKTIRLAIDLEAAVKEAAYARWKETGKKASESDIIEEALRKYLNI